MHIAFEGADGSGKSSLVKNLGKIFTDNGYKVTVDVDRPVIKESVGADYKVLSKYFDIENSDVNFFLYICLALTELYRDRKDLPKDTILISDRDIASMYIYSSLDRYQLMPQKAYMKIAKLIYDKYSKPDITFFIDVSLDELIRRVASRKKNPKYYSAKASSWWNSLYAGYQSWYKKNKKSVIKITSNSPLVVEEQVLDILRNKGVLHV